MSERRYSARMVCSPETRDKIMIDCVAEFLRFHPEMEGMNITQSFMLSKIADHYLKRFI